MLKIPYGKDVHLPEFEGPKLHPFRPFGKVKNLKWIRQVAITEHSEVYKVKIDGMFYALKVVS